MQGNRKHLELSKGRQDEDGDSKCEPLRLGGMLGLLGMRRQVAQKSLRGEWGEERVCGEAT